jgi:hypothetical protein
MGVDEASVAFRAHVDANETTVDVGAHVDAHEQRTRAKQTIPPALRREVLRRDGGRCRVPGCRHATLMGASHYTSMAA